MTRFEFKDAYETKRDELSVADEAQATITFGSRSGLIEGFRTEARIRDFKLTVDEPEVLGGTDKGPNPVELVLAALGTCQEITYRLYADALGIPLDGVSVAVEGDLDLRGFFGAKDGVRAGYKGIRAIVTLDSPAGTDELQRLKKIVDRRCPVLDMLRNPVPVETTVEIRATAPAAE